MKLLNNLKFKTKLIIILILPLTGILYFSVTFISDSMKTVSEMKGLEDLTALSVRVSALVHETQKERGRTAGYLGAQGKSFVQEIEDQRKLTDNQLLLYREFLRDFDRSQFDIALSNQLDEIERDFSRLEETRSRINRLDIVTSDAINYYTFINAKLLGLISFGARISTEGLISARLFAYVNFLQAKERAGIERAVLSNTFAADKFGPGMLQKFISLTAMQEAFLDNFFKTATSADLEKYDELSSHNSFALVEEMRSVALEHSAQGGFNVDAGYWFDTITEKINQLKQIDDSLAAKLSEEAGILRSKAVLFLAFLIVLIVVGLGLTAGIYIFFISNLMGQLGGEPAEIEEITGLVSRGDLLYDHDRRRKLSGVYKNTVEMMEKLKNVISQAISASDQVASASSEIAKGNQDLSIRTEQQATALEETSSSMEVMSSSIRSNANNTDSAVKLADVALTRSREGKSAVDQMIRSMGEISEAGEKISDILEVINGIAFQTNLLALNASIEAARAGVHGKGFAVVAVEVRKLARKSDKAAGEIAAIIKQSNIKTDEGVHIAEKTGKILDEIHNSFSKVNSLVIDISTASREQLSGIEQINSAISSLDLNTQKNAALVEEAASATEQMSSQALALNQNMSFFKIS